MKLNAHLNYKDEFVKGNNCFKDLHYEQALQCYRTALEIIYEKEKNSITLSLDINKIKSKIEYCNWNIRDKAESHTHLGCVIYHLQRFDIEMLNDLLDDQLIYQNYGKKGFLKDLSDAFLMFSITEDTYLNRVEGYCNSKQCHNNKKGYSFIGNNSMHYLNLVFEVENDKVIHIDECDNLKCSDMIFEPHKRVSLDLPF